MAIQSLAFLRKAPLLSAACLILILALAAAVWQISAIQQERDGLSQDLLSERQAHARTRVSVEDLEMKFATYVLENKVRREFVDERMEKQEERSAELKEQEQAVRQQKLAEANCITPKTVLNLAGI